jgi:hypothetical protein
MPTKPTITLIQGSSPAGMETPSTDSQAQSIEVTGTGFVSDMVLVIEGPNPINRSEVSLQVSKKGSPQGLEVISDTKLAAVVKFPTDSNGPHQALVFSSSTGVASDWFSFNVK